MPNPSGRGELLPGYRYHAFLTDTTLSTVEDDLIHRAYAVIEQVFVDLIDGPLTHLPSGHFTAHGAWLIRATLAHWPWADLWQRLFHTTGQPLPTPT